MRKGKFFKTLAVFGACLGAPLLLTGCQAGDNDLLEFRVQDGYVQYTKDGKTWENIISADDLKGQDGTNGTNGEDGNGIKSITIDQANSDSTKTTYIITFDDNTTYSYVVKNGTDGEDGEDGKDGSVVTIGEDGYWYIDGVKTDVKAKGTDGEDGTDGTNGVDGNGIKSITIDQANSDETKTTYIITFDDNTTYSFEVKNGTDGEDGQDGTDGSVVTIGEDGYWYIDGVKTDVKAKGTDGEDGTDGTNGVDGNGIKSITIDSANSDETKTTYIITFDDNTTYSFEVINGVDGQDAEIDTYTITYDYGAVDTFFAEVKETETIKATQWLTTLPEINSEYQESFLGWFVSGTEKQIKNYDFIGGNVTLEARFDVKTAPAGLYQNGKCTNTWDSLKSRFTISNNSINSYYQNIGIDGHLVIDESITSIGMGALKQSGLTGVTFSSNLNSIGVDAFAYCSNLKNVYFNSSITTLGAEMFKDCVSLEEITIPGTVKSIPDYIFSGCTNLSKITIENGVESIGSLIASGTNLKTIYIPQSINNIDAKAFTSSSLEEYIVDEKNTIYSTIDGLLYNKDKTELISCPSGFNGTDGEYTIPSGVTKIGYQAFYLSNLISITLADTIQTIGSEAFYDCDSLDGMYIPASVTEIGKNAFEGCKEEFILVMRDKENSWSVNNSVVTISTDGRSASVDGGEEIALGTLITSTYASYIWTKQVSE